MKRNLIGRFYRPAKKCVADLYKTMHFNYIFDYHFHISEKNNRTVTWLLLIVSLVVLHAGIIYLHNCRLTGGGNECGVKKYMYEAIWLLRFNPLISRKYKPFFWLYWELYWVTQSACTRNVLLCYTTKQEGESPIGGAHNKHLHFKNFENTNQYQYNSTCYSFETLTKL